MLSCTRMAQLFVDAGGPPGVFNVVNGLGPEAGRALALHPDVIIIDSDSPTRDTLEQLAEVKRIVVEVARDCAVLNADDIHCLRMADHTKANRIAYVTTNPRHELVRKHLRAGGLAAVLEEGINGQMITLYDKGAHLPLLWTHLIPATLEGKARYNVENALAVVAMARALKDGLDLPMQQRFASPALCRRVVEVGCQAGPEIGLVGRIPFIQGVVRCPGCFFIAPGGQCSILPMGAPTDVGQDSQGRRRRAPWRR